MSRRNTARPADGSPLPATDLFIAVLGSSRPVEGDPEYETARAVGREIARQGAVVLCGGYGGTMEAACRGAAEDGGRSVGVVIQGKGEPNRWVSRVEIASDLADRLRRLRDLAAAWIVLPRGLGTLLEISWIAESIVKGDTAPRPLVFLGRHWDSIVEMLVEEAAGAGKDALATSIRRVSVPHEAVAAGLAGL